MEFRVRHTSRYCYAGPVSLGPHIIRLHPRPDPNVRLLEYTCDITPRPCNEVYRADPAGNRVLHANFDTPTKELLIDSRLRARTVGRRPLESGESPGLPISYASEEAASLGVCCREIALDPGLKQLLLELERDSQQRAGRFLDLLNSHIYSNISRVIRDEGIPQTPVQTLQRGRGACRDVAVLFIALCRALGFAARFVSGYQAKAEGEHRRRFLHAWPEVYLPGSGWRGYDPTHGTPVDDAHIAIAAAPEPYGAAPVEGSYYGAKVDSELTFEISIEVS